MLPAEIHIKSVASYLLSGEMSDIQAKRLNERSPICAECPFIQMRDTLKVATDLTLPVYKCTGKICRKSLDLKIITPNEICPKHKWPKE